MPRRAILAGGAYTLDTMGQPLSPLQSNGLGGPNRKPPTVDDDARAASADLDELNQPDPARQERIEYLQSLMPERRKRRWPRVLGWILVLLLLAGGGFAGWWFVLRDEPADTPKHEPAAQTTPSATKSLNEKPVMKQYESSSFGLNFDYPEQWTVTDASDKLTVASPVEQLQTADGKKQSGRIVLSVQGKAASLEGFKKGNATAIRDSEKIRYAKPTQSQRAETYLTFLNYADASATGLDAIVVSGDNGYKKGQAVPQADVEKGDPHIVISFRSCAATSNAAGSGAASSSSSSSCNAVGNAVTLPASIWDDRSFAVPVRTMLESLAVQ